MNERRDLLLGQPDDRPQLLAARRNGYGLGRILTDHPELKALRVATAWMHAAGHRGRYAELVGPDDRSSDRVLARGGRDPARHLWIPGVVAKGSPVSA